MVFADADWETASGAGDRVTKGVKMRVGKGDKESCKGKDLRGAGKCVREIRAEMEIGLFKIFCVSRH